MKSRRDSEDAWGAPRLSDRPRVDERLFVGDSDSDGVLELLMQLLDDALARHLAGEVSTIDVHVARDHFSVRDDGPGLSRRELAPASLRSRASAATLGIGGYSNHRRSRSITLINSLSMRLEVLSSRHGARRRWLFESFDPVVSGTREGPADEPGTTVRVWPNPELFASTAPDLTALEARLEVLDAVRPSLQLSLNGHALAGPQGPRAWVRAQLEGSDVRVHQLDARRGSTRVELAYARLPPFGAARCLSFVNLTETPADGSHVEALVDALARTHEVAPAMVRERCLAMISVLAPNPRLRTSPRARLDDEGLYRWIFDLVEHERRD